MKLGAMGEPFLHLLAHAQCRKMGGAHLCVFMAWCLWPPLVRFLRCRGAAPSVTHEGLTEGQIPGEVMSCLSAWLLLGRPVPSSIGLGGWGAWATPGSQHDILISCGQPDRTGTKWSFGA